MLSRWERWRTLALSPLCPTTSGFKEIDYPKFPKEHSPDVVVSNHRCCAERRSVSLLLLFVCVCVRKREKEKREREKEREEWKCFLCLGIGLAQKEQEQRQDDKNRLPWFIQNDM